MNDYWRYLNLYCVGFEILEKKTKCFWTRLYIRSTWLPVNSFTKNDFHCTGLIYMYLFHGNFTRTRNSVIFEPLVDYIEMAAAWLLYMQTTRTCCPVLFALPILILSYSQLLHTAQNVIWNQDFYLNLELYTYKNYPHLLVDFLVARCNFHFLRSLLYIAFCSLFTHRWIRILVGF